MRMSHRLVGAVCAALVIVGAAAWLSSPVARAGSDDISGRGAREATLTQARDRAGEEGVPGGGFARCIHRDTNV